jgi:hypothetical protein
MRFIFIAIFMTFATQASADVFTYADIKNLKHIEVVLSDRAKNACWTNLSESRQYAEEKLRGAGATLFSPDTDEKYYGEYYAFIIDVASRRSKTMALCYGSIVIKIATPVSISGNDHDATAQSYQAIFTGKQNVNVAVIESIQTFLEKLKDI